MGDTNACRTLVAETLTRRRETALSELNQAFQDVPVAGLVPLLLLVVIGLVLWAAGRRVLRAALTAAGLLVGGGIGWGLGRAIAIDGIDPWIPAAIVALAAGCFAALAYRVAVAGALALVCAVTGPASVVMLGEIQGVETSEATATASADTAPRVYGEIGTEPPGDTADEADDAPDEASDWLFRGAAGEMATGEAVERMTEVGVSSLGLDEAERARLEEARGAARGVVDAFIAWWESTPQKLRPAIIAAAVSGAVVGLLFGTLAAGLSASVVSAFGGSLVWLGGVRLLLGRLGEPIADVLPTTTISLLLVWLIISLVGVAIQWTFRPKPTDTAD